MKKILAVASGGVPWAQLQGLVPAFGDGAVAYVTTFAGYRSQVGASHFYVVNDPSPWNVWGRIKLALKLAWIILRERPEVIVSTGATPGYIALRLARLVKARTVWIDSIAHIEALSLPGRKIGKQADLWLTQWPHLARPEGPHFHGAVL
jgi:hypothetical protein